MNDRSGVGSIITLFRAEASLAEAAVWLRELHLKGKRAPLLTSKLLELLNDGLLPDGMLAKRLDEDGFLRVEQAGVELGLDDVSDGYRAVIALVLDLLVRLTVAYGPERVRLAPRRSKGAKPRLVFDCPGVVLIDEAETHLHPSWQRKLGFWLVEHFPALQFIVTIHSPFVCQAALHGSLIHLPAIGEDRSPAVDERTYWAVVNGSPDDAVLSDLFGLQRLRSDAAEALRAELAELEVRRLRKKNLSERERQRLDALLNQLPNDPNAERSGDLRSVGPVITS